MEVPTEAGQPRRFINKAKLLRLLRDSSISRDRPVDRLTKIRRCAERAQAGKASIDGDQLRLHHDYAFAFVPRSASTLGWTSGPHGDAQARAQAPALHTPC